MKKTIIFIMAAALFSAACGPRQNKSGEAGAEQTDSTAVSAVDINNLPEEPIFDIVTNMGTIKVKLYSKTPKHRDNFVKLAGRHFYDGILFHRVIDGFMIQAGDPFTKDTSKVDKWGQGGPGYTVPAEFVNEYYHKKGALAAARLGDMANPTRASSGSQFYLVQDEMNCLHLDGQYTIFGETIQGLDVIDRIAKVETDGYDRPVKDVIIKTVKPDFESMKKAQESKNGE